MFGGNTENTVLYQIDVWNDYLSIAGSTSDSQITGINFQIPFLAVSSISIAGKYYWIKALPLKAWYTFSGTQFSPDGALLIAHSGGFSNFIVIFNSSNGNIISARSYSDGGFENFDSHIKSMIVSSGTSPMAYVVSQNRVSSTTWQGQRFFKFNPLFYSTTPLWILSRVEESYLGLVFGRDENFLYASTAINSMNMVSLLDTNANQLWQYSLPSRSLFWYQSFSIKYQAIDTLTDMIIVTSHGLDQINYNRIISSTASPYTVSTSQSQTFTDPTTSSTSSSSRQLKGIYIIDINNAVSLIWDYTNTDLATINFQVPSISFQRAFPEMFQVPSVIFTSPTIYYAGFLEIYLYTGQTSINLYVIQPIQAVVYSSDSTSTSCYSMRPIAVSSPITMTISSINSLSSPVYSSSVAFSFNNDTHAYTVVDIIQSKLKRISQCPIFPFTVNFQVKQQTSTFYAAFGLSDSYFPITPFQGSINCGTQSNTWLYSGYDNSDGHQLISVTDQMSVNSSTGEIFVSKSKPIGTYQVKVVGTLPDQLTTTYEVFTINVYLNQPPTFSSKLDDVTVLLMSRSVYQFPSIIDQNSGDRTSVSEVKDSLTGLLPSFMSLFSPISSLIINPTNVAQMGTYTMIVIITDYKETSQYQFNLTIARIPEFARAVIKQIDLISSNPANYTLPIMEGVNDEYIIHSPILPSFVSFKFPVYQFFPDKLAHLGISIIQGKLFNSYSSLNFKFILNVTNNAPYLSDKIPDQIIFRGIQTSYFIPQALDREGQKISYDVHQVGKQTLPVFTQFNKDTKEFKFSPTKLDPLQEYKIQLDLTDSFGASSFYQFNIIMYDLNSFQSLNSSSQLKDQVNKQEAAQYQILGMEIIRVTRDQKAIIKITNINKNSFISEIFAQISNTSLEILMMQSNASFKINFEIENKDLSRSLIQLNLKYPDPGNVSINQKPDQLKIITIRRVHLLNGLVQTILPEKISAESNIPVQITSISEKSFLNTFKEGRIVFTKINLVKILIGFIIQMIWIQLEDISFLAINSLIAISIPGIPSNIQSVLIKYMYFDILYTELWISSVMEQFGLPMDSILNDQALNLQFLDNGYDSKQFLINSGSSLFFLILFIISWIILILLSLLSRWTTKFVILKQKLRDQLIWKQTLNYLMGQFSPLFLCSAINLNDLRFNDEQRIPKFSSFISVILFISGINILAFIFLKVFQITKKLDNQSLASINHKYFVLRESLKDSNRSKLIYFWKPLYLLRWAITLLTLTFLSDKPSFQILILLILSVIWQSLILKSQPFDSRPVNVISFCNEFSVSIYLYVSFLLTDFLQDQLQDVNENQIPKLRLAISWILTSILIFTIFINFLFALVRIFQSAKMYLKKKFPCLRQTDVKYLQQQNIRNKESSDIPLGSLILEKTNNLKSYPELTLPFETNKVKIHDMFEKKEEEKIEEFDKNTPEIKIEQVMPEFRKMGYQSLDDFPDAYVFAKGEQMIDEPHENKNSLFDFYDNI